MSIGAPRARVFFALWPDPGVRDLLAEAARSCALECDGRPTPADKIHLTLFFVGDIDRAAIAAVQSAAGAVKASRFELSFAALRYWRHNRIVWASAQCPPQLQSLVSDLTQALGTIGVNSEERPYVAHVTLLRNARKSPTRTRIAPIEWHAREFVLAESVSSNRGSRYEIAARWPLGAD